ncbi:MAG: nicotinamide mononucleotide transporter [Thermoguttaceae bacterium]|nr:nicotinamide mononucleotide transporter [Thermoguttaceae bacterium]
MRFARGGSSPLIRIPIISGGERKAGAVSVAVELAERRGRERRTTMESSAIRRTARVGRTWLANELRGWRVWEVAWLAACCAIICGLALYWNEGALGVVSAVCGVAYVVLAGKGKTSAFLFGVVNVLAYSWISYEARYFGETTLNLAYYLPAQFLGFYYWNRSMDAETGEARKRRASRRTVALGALAIGVGTAVYGEFLRRIGGAAPFADALTTVASVVAMAATIKTLVEQWAIWFTVNSVTIFLWARAFLNGEENAGATLVMWALYWANAVVMWVKWEIELRRAEKTGVFS